MVDKKRRIKGLKIDRREEEELIELLENDQEYREPVKSDKKKKSRK